MAANVQTGLTKVAKVARTPRPHPLYSEMVRQAIAEQHDSSGSLNADIHRYVVEKYPLGRRNSSINNNVRLVFERRVERATLLRVIRSDVSGIYKLSEEKTSIWKDKDNVNSKKPKPAGSPKKGTASMKKANVKKSKTSLYATSRKAKSAIYENSELFDQCRD